MTIVICVVLQLFFFDLQIQRTFVK